jgi:type IV secretory pathway VirB4 component
MPKRTSKKARPAPEPLPKDFLDMIAPAAVKFNTDHFILGSTYHCVMALRSYPATTEELALLSHLGERSGVNLSICLRRVTTAEEQKIIQNASNRSKFERGSTNNMQQSVTAEANLQDVATMVAALRRSKEPLMHCAVYINLAADSLEALRTLRDTVTGELIRSRLEADRLLLKQREGFLSANPAGRNAFGSKCERVLPASSVANLYPSNYSGKTDPQGFYIGRDKFGSNIIVDLDRRADDKTNASVLILGNSGQGKSFLLKLLVTNLLESGKSVICLDPENEMGELCGKLGGCFIDLTSGKYRINPLEPKLWDMGGESDEDAPAAFSERSRLSQHISFLKDFFRSYKDFSDRHIDAIELMLERLYGKWGINDHTDHSTMHPADYPILSDLYAVIQDAYQNYDRENDPLYPAELLQEILLGLHSLCKGAESKFFNGYTNVTSEHFLVFGVKGLSNASQNLRGALLFNILSFLSDRVLSEGNTVAVLDELHVWLSNPTAIEYIRGMLKRCRKKDSSLIMASQNIEDFALPGVAEMTKPLFSIPTHQFLFNAGSIDRRFFMDNLQLEDAEYDIVRFSLKTECLYKCGNERHQLVVVAPPHKAALFGKAGGR